MFVGKVEELVVILIIVLVLFGGKQLPKLAQGIGESVRAIRKGFSDDSNDSKPTATDTKSV